MDYKELWEEMCFSINKHKNDSEREFQIVAESFFEKLGWKQYKGELVRPSIPFGANHHGIPDLVIQSNGVNLFVVELKKVNIGISERNEQQLISYMRQLKIAFGVLIGRSLQIYYDIINDSKPPIKIIEVDFEENEESGPIIIEQLSKSCFSKEKFEAFCKDQIKKQTMKIENNKQIDSLCSIEGEQYIIGLLSTEYSNEVLKEIEVSIKRKNPLIDTGIRPKSSISGPKIDRKERKPIKEPSLIYEPELVEYNKKQNETIQDWVKRILVDLFEKNIISKSEIERLHNEEYSKDIFGIGYALLCDNEKDISYAGRKRYWTKWKLQGDGYDYFVCSQWDVNKSNEYKEKIQKWLMRILHT